MSQARQKSWKQSITVVVVVVVVMCWSDGDLVIGVGDQLVDADQGLGVW